MNDVVTLNIDKVKPYLNNPRKITKNAIDAVVNSISLYGFQQPIVVDKDNTVVVGHTRLQAAIQLGMTEVPIQYAKKKNGEWLTTIECEGYRLADNRSGEYSKWDTSLLVGELETIKVEIPEVDLSNYTGFSEKEILKLLGDDTPGEDDVPDTRETDIKLGDVFTLGRHKIMCGDCTNVADVSKLMDNHKANMVLTDPPYGIGYTYNSCEDVKGKPYLDFCDKWFPILKDNSDFIIITTGWKYNKYWADKEPTDIFYWIARNKQSGGKNSHFRKVEPIVIFGKPINRYDFDFFDYNTSREGGLQGDHSCPKPMSLISDLLLGININDTALDVFLGSGTTLIACEKRDRICYGIEIDPVYCQLTIDRWEEFTGNKAKKI